MQATNVKLSAAEMALACNMEVLLTKNSVIRKVYGLFGQLVQIYELKINGNALPSEILSASPKISRGENYRGLPWVMLDYPRYFKKDDFFSIRTFFWWGNYFSTAFLVKGKCLELIDLEKMLEKKWLISTVNDPWQHHVWPENTLPVNKLEINAIQHLIKQTGFLKLQAIIAIKDWDNVAGFMENSLVDFMGLLKNNAGYPLIDLG